MPAVYDRDFLPCGGAEQATALRAGDLATLDPEYLAGKIEGLVRSDRRALASEIERLLRHLLKWRFQMRWRSTRPGLRLPICWTKVRV
jgi:hypothetical protein